MTPAIDNRSQLTQGRKVLSTLEMISKLVNRVNIFGLTAELLTCHFLLETISNCFRSLLIKKVFFLCGENRLDKLIFVAICYLIWDYYPIIGTLCGFMELWPFERCFSSSQAFLFSFPSFPCFLKYFKEV